LIHIYSDHKDYFDSILIQISSLDKHWQRYTVESKPTKAELPKNLTLPLYRDLVYIFFCGTLYPLAVSHKVVNAQTITSLLWSYDAYTDYHDGKVSWYNKDLLRQSFKRVCNKQVEEILIGLGVAYFIFIPSYNYNNTHWSNKTEDTQGTLILYPKLQDYQFYQVVDPYTAAQQVDHWLGNILIQDTVIKPTEDKYKIIAKGHDPVISFRTESGAKRRKDKR